MDLFYKKFGAGLREVGIIPVVSVANEKELDTLMTAVLKTPVRSIEITMRNAFAPKAISLIKKNYSEISVGAGTVTTKEKLDVAEQCGADFCVSPGLDLSIVKEAIERKIPFLAGTCTPSEILTAFSLGMTTLKFFPAEAMGGVSTLKLYAGALSDAIFIPTGGITMDNFKSYAELDNTLACGGSFMVPKTALVNGDSEDIKNKISKCISIYKSKEN